MACLALTTLALCDHVQRFSYERAGVGPDSSPHALATAARGLAASIVGSDVAAAPVTIATADTSDWRWWSGSSDEFYSNGPFDTREQAIAELDGFAGYIVEAKPCDRISLRADQLLEAQYFEENDNFDFDHSEPDRIGSADVIAAADAELQALLDAWCDRFGHTFARGNMFGATRNGEAVAAIEVNDEVSA